MKTYNELIEAKGGLRIPTGAGAGLLAVSDANGNVSWSSTDMATQAELDAEAGARAAADTTEATARATHAALTTTAHGGIVASNDSRLTDVRNVNYQAGSHTARLAATATNGKLWKETDTGLIYIGNGATWDIFKAQGHVPKTAIETINNVGALQNDDHLFFPVEVNEQWFVEGFLVVTSASANSDLQAAWTGPTGMVTKWKYIGVGVWNEVLVAASPNTLVAHTTAATWGSVSGTWGATFAALMTVDATHAGTVQFQWAQNTATVEDTSLNAGSFLRLTRLA